MDEMAVGETLKITASDAGFYKDVQAWANVTGNEVLELSQDGGEISALLRKGRPKVATAASKAAGANGATLVCFSDDLDRSEERRVGKERRAWGWSGPYNIRDDN